MFCNTSSKHPYFFKVKIEVSQKSLNYVQSFVKYISFYIISFTLKFYEIMITIKKERKKGTCFFLQGRKNKLRPWIYNVTDVFLVPSMLTVNIFYKTIY